MLSPLSKNTNLENTSQFKLVKDPNSNRVNDLFLHNTIPVTLYNNLLTFRDTGKKLELKGDLLKVKTNNYYNVAFPNLSVEKILYDFAREMYFDVKATGNKSTRDGSLINLSKSPATMLSGISTTFSPENPNELCDGLKILLQEREAGNNSDLNNEEILAIFVKLL